MPIEFESTYDFDKCREVKESDPVTYYKTVCNTKGYAQMIYTKPDCSDEILASRRDTDFGKCE